MAPPQVWTLTLSITFAYVDAAAARWIDLLDNIGPLSPMCLLQLMCMVQIFHYTEPPPTDAELADRKAPTFRWTPRETAILRAVYAYRALTTPQIDALLFPATRGRTSAEPSSRCRHRMKLLAAEEYVYRREQPQLLSEGRKHYVYFLAPRGAAKLAGLDGLFPEQLDWRDRE